MTSPTGAWRRWAWVTAGLALGTALLTSCAQIPTSGPVEQADQIQAPFDDSIIRVLPRLPADGLSPDDLVSSFIEASAGFEDDHGVARQYLTTEGSDQWKADTGVVVYDDDPGLDVEQRGKQVIVRATQVGRIGADGALSPGLGQQVRARFTVEEQNGEWRISKAPNGLILTRFDVARAYRTYSLHFLAPHQDRLVPDPVFVPIGRAGAATSLARLLLKGPTRWLAPAVKTALPVGTELVVESVPIENGVALVDLTDTVLDASVVDRERLAAQLVWTLTELPDVTGVQITVEGSVLQLPEAPAVQTEETWEQYNPNGLPSSAGALIVRGGVVRRVDDLTARPMSGVLGSGVVQARHPASSADGSIVAALVAKGTRAVLEQRFVSANLETVLKGNNLAPPSMDATGSLWLVDRVEGGSRIWFQPVDSRLRTVRAPALRNRSVVSLRVSLDGTRVAVVVRTREGDGKLLIGRVVRTGRAVEVQALYPLADALTDARDVTWASADSLAALARDSGSVLQPFEVGLDGSVDELGGSVLQRIRSVTAAPGFPLLASTKGAGIWENTAVGWRRLMPGIDPAYPG